MPFTPALQLFMTLSRSLHGIKEINASNSLALIHVNTRKNVQEQTDYTTQHYLFNNTTNLRALKGNDSL